MQKTASGDWVFRCRQHKLSGFHHPTQKSALLMVMRNGTLRVLYQGQDGRLWQDFRTDLENLNGSSDILTHAAMCPERMIDKSVPEQGMRLTVTS